MELDFELEALLKEKTELAYAWICTICTDLGELLYCDLCKRGFHTDCLGLPCVPEGDWLCADCGKGKVQCFSCKEDGDVRTGMTVCSRKDCSRFYHIKCSRTLDGATWTRKGGLICPHHHCHACDALRSSKIHRCMQCPVAYHEACCPDGTQLLEDIPGFAVCWRHVNEWKTATKYDVATSSITEAFERLPLPVLEYNFELPEDFFSSDPELKETPKKRQTSQALEPSGDIGDVMGPSALDPPSKADKGLPAVSKAYEQLPTLNAQPETSCSHYMKELGSGPGRPSHDNGKAPKGFGVLPKATGECMVQSISSKPGAKQKDEETKTSTSPRSAPKGDKGYRGSQPQRPARTPLACEVEQITRRDPKSAQGGESAGRPFGHKGGAGQPCLQEPGCKRVADELEHSLPCQFQQQSSKPAKRHRLNSVEPFASADVRSKVQREAGSCRMTDDAKDLTFDCGVSKCLDKQEQLNKPASQVAPQKVGKKSPKKVQANEVDVQVKRPLEPKGLDRNLKAEAGPKLGSKKAGQASRDLIGKAGKVKGLKKEICVNGSSESSEDLGAPSSGCGRKVSLKRLTKAVESDTNDTTKKVKDELHPQNKFVKLPDVASKQGHALGPKQSSLNVQSAVSKQGETKKRPLDPAVEFLREAFGTKRRAGQADHASHQKQAAFASDSKPKPQQIGLSMGAIVGIKGGNKHEVEETHKVKKKSKQVQKEDLKVPTSEHNPGSPPRKRLKASSDVKGNKQIVETVEKQVSIGTEQTPQGARSPIKKRDEPVRKNEPPQWSEGRERLDIPVKKVVTGLDQGWLSLKEPGDSKLKVIVSPTESLRASSDSPTKQQHALVALDEPAVGIRPPLKVHIPLEVDKESPTDGPPTPVAQQEEDFVLVRKEVQVLETLPGWGKKKLRTGGLAALEALKALDAESQVAFAKAGGTLEAETEEDMSSVEGDTKRPLVNSPEEPKLVAKPPEERVPGPLEDCEGKEALEGVPACGVGGDVLRTQGGEPTGQEGRVTAGEGGEDWSRMVPGSDQKRPLKKRKINRPLGTLDGLLTVVAGLAPD